MAVPQDGFMVELETYRKALLKAKPQELQDGVLLAQSTEFVLRTADESSPLKLLELVLILLRQLASVFHNAGAEHASLVVTLVQDRIAPAFQPGATLASHVMNNLENPLKHQQTRASEVLAAAGRLSALLPPSESASSSSATFSTYCVPLFRQSIIGGLARRANLAVVSALLEHVPLSAVPSTLLLELLDDLQNVDSANQRCTLIINLLIKIHFPPDNETSVDSAARQQVIIPLLPFLDAGRYPAQVSTHMNRYLLPALFKRDPASVSVLLDMLSERPDLFAAWVGVASLGVSLGHLRIEDLPVKVTEDALAHEDADVRLRAFELVTGSKDQLTGKVLDLVSMGFEWNDSLPGTGSRSSFSSATYAFFVRLHQLETLNRRNARKKARNPSLAIREADLEDVLATTAAFRDWFLTKYIDNNLRLALRYPVFKGLLTLNLLAVYLSVFEEDAGVQEKVFTEERVGMLLACQASEFGEVRTRSRKILESALVPLAGYETLETPLSQNLLRSAVISLNHPRRTQAEAGKAVLCILFSKVVQDESDPQKSLAFISHLLDRLEVSLKAVEADLVRGMEESPLHGTLSALRDLVTCLSLKTAEAQIVWRPTFNRIFNLVDRIWVVTRTVISLAPSKTERGASEQGIPEHEIARAYEALGGGDEAEEDDEGMDHTGLLSGCWRATRNAGELLAAILVGPLSEGGGKQNVWNRDEVDRAGQCFLIWMHEIRHRGTFSSIASAFAAVVDTVRQHSDIRDLCDNWLQHELVTISSDQISTTRRSAALPYSILAIVSGDETLLDVAVDSLIDLARADNVSTSNTTKVHAFNVLKIVLLDAKQTKFFDKYFERAVLMALGAFESPDWNVRNVGLILFSTMVHRCLSSARGKQDYFVSRSTLAIRQSFSFFHTKYPQIVPFITRYLVQASTASGNTVGNKHSPLFPILIIIRSLRWSDTHQELQRDLSDAVSPFLSSREYQVRQVAAQALSSLVSPSAAVKRALEIGSSNDSKTIDLNSLHGHLLLLHLLVANVIQWDEVDSDCTQRFEEGLSELVGLHVPGIAPPITEALLATVTSCLSCAEPKSPRLLSEAVQQTNAYLSQRDSMPLVPAEEFRHSACVGFLLKHQLTKKLLVQLLARGATENDHISALETLVDNPASLDEDVFTLCLNLAIDPASGDAVQCLALEAVADLPWSESVWTGSQRKWSNVIGRLGDLSKAKCVPLREAALPALGRVMAQCLRDATSEEAGPTVQRLGELVLIASDEDQSQPSRWSALQSLHHLRRDIFKPELPLHSCTAIHRALLRLIQDDEEEIRHGAASLIASAFNHDHGRRAVHGEMLQSYWIWMQEHYSSKIENGDASWLEDLVVDKQGIERDLRVLRNDTSSEIIFGIEPPNLFRDPLVDSLNAARILAASRPTAAFIDRIRQERAALRAALEQDETRSVSSPIDDAWQARQTVFRRLEIFELITGKYE